MPIDLIFTNGTRLKAGTVYCVGRNYSAHAGEMGEAVPDTPMIFMKPAASLVDGGTKIAIPDISDDMHHEVELIAVIGARCRNVHRDEAAEHIAGYGIGVDLTLRDVQAEAKKKGRPWTLAKGFYGSAPVSEIIPAEEITAGELQFDLHVNGRIRQQGNASEMVFDIPALIEYLSKYFLLEAGDVIFTGTPEGVSRVVPGDRLSASLNGKQMLEFEIM